MDYALCAALIQRPHRLAHDDLAVFDSAGHGLGGLLDVRADGGPRRLIADCAALALAPRLLRRLGVRQLG